MGGDLQAAIRRVATVEELQCERVQDRKVRDRVIGGERVAKAERMIGGQLGHEPVGKVRAVLVNGGQVIEIAGVFDGLAACIILIFTVQFAGVGWGSGRAAIGFGHNVGHAAETGFDVQAAIIGDADENAGPGLLLIRIDRQLGVEFGRDGPGSLSGACGFWRRVRRDRQRSFRSRPVHQRVPRVRRLPHRLARARPD